MARLETQINQIYLTDPENKKTSMILYEEQISSSAQLFVLAELWDIKKKTENQDLKKISEIFLESFRANKRLAAEALFESALAQINQNLADLAHGGRKSWVGKFSAILCLKSGDNIFVANDGACACFLHRKGELLEILPAEKRGDHPFKTFVNFTQGKLLPADNLVLTTVNIFSYVSLEHFAQLLNNHELPTATIEISKILQSSLDHTQGFCTFLLNFAKPMAAVAPAESEREQIYAPLLEEVEATPKIMRWRNFSFPKLRWPGWTPKLQSAYFQKLSRPAKFFFISFAIFLLLFLVNLVNYLVNYQHKAALRRVESQLTLVNQDLTDAQSAIIYKNEEQALLKMNQAQKDFEVLRTLDASQAQNLAPRLESIKTQINKISTVSNPQVIATLKRSAQFLGKAPTAFLLADTDSNSLSQFSGNLKEYFMLNSIKDAVSGIAFFPQVGVTISAGSQIYKINQQQQLFESIAQFDNAHILSLRASGSSLYALDNGQNQIIKISWNKTKIQASQAAAVEGGARDLGADKDLYLLFANRLTKITGGQSINIPLPNLTEAITNANKLFVAGNLYILEANKKRVLVITKAGALLNQIYFPNAQNLRDFYVDEAGRLIYLLDDNKFEKITF